MKSRFKIRWIDLLSPDCYWPYPYSLEQAILAMQFLVKTAHKAAIYGKSGPVELLSKQPTCINFREINPIVSDEDLRRRFHFALLYAPYAAGRLHEWRWKNGIRLTDEKIITGSHFKPFNPPDFFAHEADFKYRFNALLSIGQKKLNEQLNDCHPRAVMLYGVQLHFGQDGSIYFQMRYGYQMDQSSAWRHTLASGEYGFPPSLVLRDAIKAVEKLTSAG